MEDKKRAVVLVGGDLNDRVRLEAGAARAGLAFERVGSGSLAPALALDPVLVVLDLDGSDAGLLEELASTPDLPRVVGYFSHVDEELGRRAQQAGCRAYPRGEFWGSLAQVLHPGGT